MFIDNPPGQCYTPAKKKEGDKVVGMNKEQIEEFLKSGVRESLGKISDNQTKKVFEDLISSIGKTIEENNAWIDVTLRKAGIKTGS